MIEFNRATEFSIHANQGDHYRDDGTIDWLTVGFFWLLIKALAESNHPSATFRYFIFDPPHLLMLVGIAVSAVSLPIALEVSKATAKTWRYRSSMTSSGRKTSLPRRCLMV
jgi:hypothetical protein